MNKIRTATGLGIVFQFLVILSIFTPKSYCRVFSGSGIKSNNNNDANNIDICTSDTPLCFAMSSQDSELRIPGQRQYRVGGLEPDSNLNQLALHANVDLKNPHADASEGTSTNGEKSQEELEQEQRQRRFKELVDSGIIDPNRKQQPPGKIYTLPVVKPKLM